jgi:PPOX class probable F420-dependent enzyme
MSVRLTPEEIDEFLTNGHTLILSTLRKSGEPFSTPVWYAYMDGAFYVGTLERSAKVRHIRRDPRVCCVVESGEAWVDLHCVIANCDAEIVDDEKTLQMVREEMARKYAAFTAPRTELPDATRRHYNRGSVVIKCTPRPGEVRSWYNQKIRMRT